VDQFNNDANWLAHYEGTGREIWEATAGRVDVVVITMGTTGTLMGTARVTLYSCGPSLDGPPDLGLCRRIVFADLLRRHLEGRGYEVKHAMNLGDIDDRTVTNA